MQIQTVKQNKNNYLVNDEVFVPFDEGNKDYQEVQKYIEEGGIVKEIPEEERVENY